MRILSMTATFGKLEHQTLTLEPGLNIIEAPNEWGKSTWCAFLAAMLYGLDTRSKTTKTALSDREHYAPWSGQPMEGRLELLWQGRRITVERRTVGRVPLGHFRAYETQSGQEVPELTAAACGQVLLGVEKSVFLRSAFIRSGQMPVTADEALRRRLHGLVTSGAENAAGDRLGTQLRELKNRVRYNRTGLLPQLEAQLGVLDRELEALEGLNAQIGGLEESISRREAELAALENHARALCYRETEENNRRVAAAEAELEQARARLRQREAAAAGLPAREAIEQKLELLESLEDRQQALLTRTRQPPAFARGLSGEALLRRTEADAARCARYCRRPRLLYGAGLLLIGALAAMHWYPLPGRIAGVCGGVLLAGALLEMGHRRKRAEALQAYYGSPDPEIWLSQVREYLTDCADGDRRGLETEIDRATEGLGLRQCRSMLLEQRREWARLETARREAQTLGDHLQALRPLSRPLPALPGPDRLTYSREETQSRITEARRELAGLRDRLSQARGRREGLDSGAQLHRRREALVQRMDGLERHYAALTLAQETLAEAEARLRRRFAPAVASAAAARMTRLTGGRYDRVRLGQDLDMLAGAEGEDTLRELLWRSEGTGDQLYLSLRLAVAELLLPESPLILDDALIRFDDTRLKAALTLLEEESRTRQVILFTCQSREKRLL